MIKFVRKELGVKIRLITQKIANSHGYKYNRRSNDVGLYKGLSTKGDRINGST